MVGTTDLEKGFIMIKYEEEENGVFYTFSRQMLYYYTCLK